MVTNPTNERSTLEVSEGLLGDYWTILSFLLLDWNLDTINCFLLINIFVEGILLLGCLVFWNNQPREPRFYIGLTNLPTGYLTMGVSEGTLGYP